MDSFDSSYQQLQDFVSQTGFDGEWRDLPDRSKGKQFRAHNGAVLNWWPTTRTVNFQGSRLESAELESKLSEIVMSGTNTLPV